MIKVEWSKNLRIIGIIFSITLFLISLKVNFIGVSDELLNPVVRAIVIFIATLLLSDNIARIASKHESDKQYDEFKNMLQSKVDCRFFRNSEEGIEYVRSNLKQIKNIENTHMKNGDIESADSIYNSKIYQQFIKELKVEIERGLVFRDVVGESSLNYRKDHLSNWATENSSDRRVFSKVVKSNTPIVNHLILTYLDGKKEILFGWAYMIDRPIENVFLSNNKELINYFSLYFENLYSLGEKI